MILLDVMLPDMEGFAVCGVLRGNTLTKYIPITFLTQRDARADKVAGLQLGADDYVTKPFDIEELRLRVERSIQRATRDHLHEPRTGLPMTQMIESEYRRIYAEDGWQKYLLIIEGFQAFKDVYGFLAADEAISLAARVLTDAVGKWGTQDDFIGITDTSQFVIFTHSDQHATLLENLTTEFKTRAATLYSFADIDQGFIMTKVEAGASQQAPLMQFKTEEYALAKN